jgi:hypothetical protein
MKYLNDLIIVIKEKKELSSLDNSYVLAHLVDSINQLHLDNSFDESYTSFKQFLRSSICKSIISLTRKKLRTAYGVYIKEPLSSFQKTIFSLSSFNDSSISYILQSHQSSKEREGSYKKIYESIFFSLKELGFPQDYSLMDIACGYNPFSYSFLPIKPSSYFAVDLSSKDCELINLFFSKIMISGEAFAFSILSEEFLSWFKDQESTLTFFLKTIDSVEQIKKHYSKTLLCACPSKFMVVSFPLVSIGGKHSLGEGLRTWFTRFCTTQGWVFKHFSLSDEIFYIIKKS